MQMFNKKISIYLIFLLLLFFATEQLYAQNKYAFFKDAVQEKRNAFYKMVISSIDKTFSLTLDSTNEQQWLNAFYNIALVRYKTQKVNAKIDSVAKVINLQNDELKKGFLNLINSEYPKKYYSEVKTIFANTADAKTMAMAANYLLQNSNAKDVAWMKQEVAQALINNPTDIILERLIQTLKHWNKKIITPSLKPFFDKNYLPKIIILFSFQRKDRNYPGLAMIRKADGNFYKNDSGIYFSTGQLARSLSNMPGYISNGNTPQGFFKMNGFDTSSNYFIGTTTNIQLSMPHEYNRSTINENIIDSTWTIEQYKNLLPLSFQNYEPLYESFYAGKIGRTEIIAHGTTVDPSFYKTNSYYPYTPTMGCLTSVETWSSKTGFLQTSNQLLLTQALQKAGGANGYLIVIEIDDKKAPVILSDIKKYLP
jgi:hypothetical protein